MEEFFKRMKDVLNGILGGIYEDILEEKVLNSPEEFLGDSRDFLTELLRNSLKELIENPMAKFL